MLIRPAAYPFKNVKECRRDAPRSREYGAQNHPVFSVGLMPYGSHGYLFGSSFRFSRCAVMKCFASSLM
jgi:hypothetical protein